jgi:hypothetical protein
VLDDVVQIQVEIAEAEPRKDLERREDRFRLVRGGRRQDLELLNRRH